MAAPLLQILRSQIPKLQCGCAMYPVLDVTQNCRIVTRAAASELSSSRFFNSDSSSLPPTLSNVSEKGQKISQAMKAYLQRAQSYEKFMNKEIMEYEIGKRHLANIMGADPDTFSQEDIDKAIEYLLPSSLFVKPARPLMKHPTEALPMTKAAMFSADGRPYHFLFYTGKPNFYQHMFETAQKLDQLKELQDKSQGENVSETSSVFVAGSKWIDLNTYKNMVQEKVTETDLNRLLLLLERVAEQPNSSLEKEYIYKFRKMLTTQSLIDEIKPELVDENGRVFQIEEGKRKSALAKVKLYRMGTGVFTVNGQHILDYFPRIIDRQQLLFPLQLSCLVDEVDVIATVELGGESSQAGAIRLALARALQTFVDTPTLEKMRLSGLLTRDPRVRERKKFGQQGARRKFTWKKR